MTHRRAVAIVIVAAVFLALFILLAIAITDGSSRNIDKWQYATRRTP